MKIKNVSNYPVLVKGVDIKQGESKEVDIEDEEYYRNDRRFLLEDDDESEAEEVEEESVDEVESSKPKDKKYKQGD